MKKFSALILSIIFCLMFITPIFADNFARTDLKIDESLSDETTKDYAQPQFIWVTQVIPATQDVAFNSKYWYQTLYYYSITRLGYTDIPFTYLVDRDGNIFNGRSGGIDVIPNVSGKQGGVLIGYMSSGTDITNQAQKSFQKIISDTSYQYAIGKDKVKVVSMQMIKSTDSVKPTETKLTEIHTVFTQNVNQIVDTVTFYEKEHINYQAEVVSITYDKEAKAGDKMHVDLSIKNTNNFAWFTDKKYIYISTNDFRDTPFAVNGVWDSFTKPLSIQKRTILPGETVKFAFDMQASLLPGTFTVRMGLTKDSKTVFDGSLFTMKLKVIKGDFKLVQIKDVPGGYLNVRSAPGNHSVVSQVASGHLFIMKEKSVGWYKIVYSDKKEGWVYGEYIKEIQ